MPVKHFDEWKKGQQGKNATWKNYRKYVVQRGGSFGGEIHYWKAHHMTHDDHKAHDGNKHTDGSKDPKTGAKAKPDMWDDVAHNNEFAKRLAQMKKDKEDGKYDHIYKAASSVRKILVPSHTEISQAERQSAHLSKASRMYYEHQGNTEAKQNIAQQYLDQVDMGREYKVSNLSNQDGLVVERGSYINNEWSPNGKVELAYRGTNKTHLGDLKTDARIIAGMEEGGSQDQRARQQIEAVKERYGANSIDHFQGYSKGGGQALIYGARENVRTTALNPLIGKTMMAKQNTTANLKVIRTTGDGASIGLMGSNHPYEVKTIYPIKEGLARGLEPLTQSYQEHRLENFIVQDAERARGAGSNEILTTHEKAAKQGEMETLHHAIETKNRGGSFTDYIHELQGSQIPATESHFNQHADHSIVGGEKRLAGGRHQPHATTVRNWENIGGEFTPQEAAFISGRNDPYNIRGTQGEYEWGRLKPPPKPKRPELSGMEESFGRQLTEGERLASFGLGDDIRPQRPLTVDKGKLMNPSQYRKNQQELLNKGKITKSEFESNMGKYFEKKMLFKGTTYEYNYNQDRKKIKRAVADANDRKVASLGDYQAEFGEGRSNTLSPKEYREFIEAGTEGRMNKIHSNNAEIIQHAYNTSEYFAPTEHTSGLGWKSLASSFHPTSMAMGLGAGIGAEKAMDLIDPDHNMPLVPRDLLVGSAAGAGGYGMASGLGVAGEAAAARGLVSAGALETMGLAAGGVGLLPEMIAGGAGYVVGDLAGRGSSALIKEIGGDKEEQEWGGAVLGGMAGGATTGAIIGSAVPVIGTAVGAAVGAVGGAAIGAIGKAFSSWF